MIVKKTFQYRLKITSEAEKILFLYTGGSRFIYNWGLAQYKQALEKSAANPEAKEKLPTAYGLCHEVVALKKNPETVWLKRVPAQALQQALGDLALSMRAFFRERKRNPLYGFPRFKARGHRDSFRIPQGIKWQPYQVFIPKIGWVEYYDRYNRPIEGSIKQATVKYDGVHWYITIVTDLEIADIKPRLLISDPVTIQVSHEQIVTPDQTIPVPHFMDSDLKKIKMLGKRLSRCTKDSKRYAKMKRKLAKAHITIKNRRKDFLHKQTSSLVEKYDHLQITQLDLIGKIMTTRRWHVNRRQHDLAIGNFNNYLTYKALWYGKQLTIVKPIH